MQTIKPRGSYCERSQVWMITGHGLCIFGATLKCALGSWFNCVLHGQVTR